MKKFLAVLLCGCLMMGVAAGCGTEQAETETEETNEVKVYPEHIDAFVDTANFGEPPEIIYTTPASENGLEGELYKIEGEVTESEVTEGEEGMSIGSFTVKTDVGEVSVIDPSLLLSESGVEYGGFTDEILQKYFAVPKVGEKVCVYAEYAGYSDVLQAPACYYGGQKYIEKVVTSMLMDNGYADDSEDAEKQPDSQKSTMTEQEKIENSARQICAENYKSTAISDITVNENLGTDAEGDYILLVDLTWNVKNSKDTTKKMLAMYSEDFAARIGTDLQNVSEITVFWKVPYYSKTDTVVKYTYTRKDNGMYQTDAMISKFLN